MMRLPTLRAAVAAIIPVILLTACNIPLVSSTPTPGVDATAVPSPTSAPTSTPAPTSSPALALDPALLKDVRLAFIHPWSGEARLAIEQMTAEFNEENIWGIKVDLVAAGSAGEEFGLVSATLDEGGLPQVAAVAPDHAAAWETKKSGILIDLIPFIGDKEWGMRPDEVEDYFPVIWQQTIRDGRQTGIPAQRSLELLIYNQSWAEELGFSSLPASAAEFQEQVCAATRANSTNPVSEKVGTGGYILSTDSTSQLAWMAAFGLDPAALDTFQGYRFEGTPAEESFTFFRQLFENNCTWPPKNPQPFDYFARRQALAYAASMADLPQQESAMKMAENSDRWTVIAFPGADDRRAVLETGLNFVILDSNPPEELASWVFIHWLMLPRNQIELAAAASSLPLSQAAMDGLGTYGKQHPQWQLALSLQNVSVPSPAQPDWRIVKSVVEDAAWQLVQPTPQPVPEILRLMDGTISEMVK